MSRKNRKKRKASPDDLPEVRLRRHAARSARWRSVTMVFTGLLGAACLLLAAWRGGQVLMERYVYTNPAFALEKLIIRTDGPLPVERIRGWARVVPGDNLLRLDLARMKRSLELVPVIHSVSIERELPDTLRIQVRERRPVARIMAWLPGGSRAQRETRIYQIDPEGVVLKPRPEMESELPFLVGLTAGQVRSGEALPDPRVQEALALIRAFSLSAMAGLTTLHSVDFSAPGTLKVITGEGSEVTFAPTEMDRQLGRWFSIRQHGRRIGRGIATLDLSVTNNIPARWRRLGDRNGQEPATPSGDPQPHPIRRRPNV